MAQKIVVLCLGALIVSMATGAPVSTSDDQAVNAADSAVDIGECWTIGRDREESEILFPCEFQV